MSKNMTPKEVVENLNKYIIGQDDAKKAVAVALRNRWRRLQLPKELQEDIVPKNIIMIGPTGVGKTEIARKLSKLVSAPFFKVEASKFTEVGYVGRDVESMIRDLMEVAVSMVKDERVQFVEEEAKKIAADRIVNLLKNDGILFNDTPSADSFYVDAAVEDKKSNIDYRKKVLNGDYDDKEVTITLKIQAIPMMNIMGPQGSDGLLDGMDINISDMLGNILPKQEKKRILKVKDALEILSREEANKLVDMDNVQKEAKERVEENGIIFLDEIDKIASAGGGHGPEVSREGVQRDILPIVEGSTVKTKYGMVKTNHILFIAAGAFHMSKPSNLIPELQGRFPIRVELQSLNNKDFEKILKDTKNSLLKQYTAMMKTEGIDLEFTDDAIEEISLISFEANTRMENIGARRLYTILEKLLEELSFTAPDIDNGKFIVDGNYVKDTLSNIVKDRDLSRYIL